LADQMTTLDDPCFLTSFGTVCFVLRKMYWSQEVEGCIFFWNA
jgi:hypothetical protein